MDNKEWMECSKMMNYNRCLDENFYPKFSISDSIVDNIKVINNSIFLYFDDNGFFVKENDGDEYHRTKNAILKLNDCDLENINIFATKKKLFDGNLYYVKEYKDFNDFLNNINNKTWGLEIIKEYWYNLGGMFIGALKDKNERMDCYIQVEYKNEEYKYSL